MRVETESPEDVPQSEMAALAEQIKCAATAIGAQTEIVAQAASKAVAQLDAGRMELRGIGGALAAAMGALDGIAARVAAAQPREWVFTITRDAHGFAREVLAKAR